MVRDSLPYSAVKSIYTQPLQVTTYSKLLAAMLLSRDILLSNDDNLHSRFCKLVMIIFWWYMIVCHIGNMLYCILCSPGQPQGRACSLWRLLWRILFWLTPLPWTTLLTWYHLVQLSNWCWIINHLISFTFWAKLAEVTFGGHNLFGCGNEKPALRQLHLPAIPWMNCQQSSLFIPNLCK